MAIKKAKPFTVTYMNRITATAARLWKELEEAEIDIKISERSGEAAKINAARKKCDDLRDAWHSAYEKREVVKIAFFKGIGLSPLAIETLIN